MSRSFTGNIMSSLQSTISTSSVSLGVSATTSSIGIIVSNTGDGTISYSWQTTGNACTINTPSAPATTVVGGGLVGTTELFCNITNSVTGVTYSSPSCSINWTGTAPDAPTIGADSSGDKSFTINWTAPTNDGGSPITGYYVQQFNTKDNVWSTPILVSAASTSYTWSGNTIVYNGYTYKGKVAAVNNIDTGTYSADSASKIPTFAAPTINNVFGTSGYPSTGAPGLRPFNITFTPTSCVDYSRTEIYIYYVGFDDLGSYYNTVNGGILLSYASSAQQTTLNITSCYAFNFGQGGQYYTCYPSYSFYVYARTYNNDLYNGSDYYVQSATYTSYVSAAYTYGLPSGPFLTTGYSSATGQFTVTGNTFQQISTYAIPDTITQITSLSIEGWVVITGINICSAGRNFTVFFSGNTTGTYSQSNSCNTAPFTTSSGTTHQFKSWNVTDTGYQCQGAGKIRVNGGGTIGTWSTAPDQRIRVIVNITGNSLVQY